MAATGRRRGFETVGDMARSLALVVGVVLVMTLLVWHKNSADIQVVDFAAVGEAAQAAGAYHVYVPAGLPGDAESGWRATSVRYGDTIDSETATVWHVGFVTPTDRYAAVDQTNGSVDDLVRTLAPEAVQTGGTLRIIGLTWTRYEAAGEDVRGAARALVAQLEDSAIIVSGSGDWGELQKLAGSLHTR